MSESAWGSAIEHRRMMKPWPKGRRRGRRRCGCGCGKLVTHRGTARTRITLMTGCEFYVRRWVKDWRAAPARAALKEQP